MTVDIPDFDEELKWHAAVSLEAEADPMCHAAYPGDDTAGFEARTVCGQEIQGEEMPPRRTFIDSQHTMCPECWPEEIRGDD